jgi:hypothetical protein
MAVTGTDLPPRPAAHTDPLPALHSDD